MPELPEVETIRRGLQRLLPDKVVETVSFDTAKSFPNTEELVDRALLGSRILAVTRRGKALIIALETKNKEAYALVVHLKMTGQMVFRGQENWGGGHPSDSLLAKLPDASTRVILTFQDQSQLFFNDQRKFGWMLLLPQSEVQELAFFKKLGPEPLDTELSQLKEEFLSRIRRRKNTPIKAAVLDQAVVAGIGNIYADEALFAAGIHPQTHVIALTDEELIRLLESAIAVMRLSIEHGGSTDRNYIDAEGNRGSYLTFAKVFRRQNEPCLACGSTIQKIRVAGRGTHICPDCQVLKTKG